MSERQEKVNRVYAHLRVHGLEASVAARERGGRPVVICDESGQRVASASPAALRKGVRPGTSRWEAQRRCPEALVAEADDPEKYEYFWQQILDICGDYAPEVRPAPGHQVSLDLTGTRRLFGDAKEVGQEIRNRLRVEVGVAVSVGIGANRMVARLASESARPGEVVEVPPEEAAEFVGELPMFALPNVGADWAQRLGEMGIKRAKDLARLPGERVEKALGKWGRTVWEIARGGDPEERGGAREAGLRGAGGEEESVSAESDLRPPTEARERIAAGLRAAAEGAARKLREQGQLGRQVRVELVFRDLRTVGARRTLRHGTRSSEVILHAARDLLARVKLNGRLVRRVRVKVARLATGPHGGQLGLPLEAREARRERLEEMVERVRDRFGGRAVGRATLHRA